MQNALERLRSEKTAAYLSGTVAAYEPDPAKAHLFREMAHTAEEQALWVRTAQPLTRAGLGLWGVAVRRVLEQGPLLGVCPGMAMGLSKTAPPDCILDPHDPVRGPPRQRDQAITPLFLRASGGSGRVLQCCALFPLVCSRWRARRIVSSLIRRSVTPCS